MNRIDGNKAEDDAASSRKDLLRNVIVFQFKLFVDGIRDLILVPVSLVAAALDLASGAELASGNFARVLSLGRRSERYINLFGESEYPNQDPGSDAQSPGPDLDEVLGMLESRVKDRYRQEGASAVAEEAMNALRKAARDVRGLSEEDSGPSSRPGR
jgi:hypothetical protein